MNKITYPDSGLFSRISKLASIEDGATADQTGAEIAALIAALPDSNLLTGAQIAAIALIAGKADQSEVDTINSLLAVDDMTKDTLQEVIDFIDLNSDTLAALGIASIAGLQNALDAKLEAGDIDTIAKLNAVVGDATLITTTFFGENDEGIDNFVLLGDFIRLSSLTGNEYDVSIAQAPSVLANTTKLAGIQDNATRNADAGELNLATAVNGQTTVQAIIDDHEARIDAASEKRTLDGGVIGVDR